MTIQVGIPPFAPGLSVHDHTDVAQGGKLNKYNDVFNNPDLIMNILSDHNKTVHNALGIDADTVDGIDFPSAIAAVLTDHTKTTHDALGLDHEQLSNIIANAHHLQLHAAAHKAAGGDPIKIDELAVPDDNTFLNVLTTKHGLCPKLPNDSAKFLDGIGDWVTPGGAGLQVKSGSYIKNCGDATGNVVTSGLGFAPKMIVVKCAKSGGVAVPCFVGFYDETVQTCLERGDTGDWQGHSDRLGQLNAGSGNYTAITGVSLNGDGFTLLWTKNGTGAGFSAKFMWAAFG